MNFERCNDYFSLVFKYLENYWKSIADELCLRQPDRPITTISNCGDNIFSIIYHLMATEFNVQSLRL